MTALRDALITIRDTFQRDIDQGYKTRDKVFAIDLANAALADVPVDLDAELNADLASIINAHWSDTWTAGSILECSNVPICYALEAQCRAYLMGRSVEAAVINANPPPDVRRLVIAARDVAFGGAAEGSQELGELDKASEAFASRIPWDDDPNDEDVKP